MPRVAAGKRKRDDVHREQEVQEGGGASSPSPAPPHKNSTGGSSATSAGQPNPNDIILGRGVLHAGHPGNVRYYQLLDEHMASYAAAPTEGAKTRIVRAAHQRLSGAGGGPFLENVQKDRIVSRRWPRRRSVTPSGIANDTTTIPHHKTTTTTTTPTRRRRHRLRFPRFQENERGLPLVVVVVQLKDPKLTAEEDHPRATRAIQVVVEWWPRVPPVDIIIINNYHHHHHYPPVGRRPRYDPSCKSKCRRVVAHLHRPVIIIIRVIRPAFS